MEHQQGSFNNNNNNKKKKKKKKRKAQKQLSIAVNVMVSLIEQTRKLQLSSTITKEIMVLHRDEGNLVKTNTWNPIFVKLFEKEINTKTCCQICQIYNRF